MRMRMQAGRRRAPVLGDEIDVVQRDSEVFRDALRVGAVRLGAVARHGPPVTGLLLLIP